MLEAGPENRFHSEMPAELRRLPLWKGAEAVAPGQFVYRGEDGEIVVAYPDPNDSAKRIVFRFRLYNRVDPIIRVAFKREDLTIEYRYTVANGAGAPASIERWQLVGPANRNDVFMSHPTWPGCDAHVPVAPQWLLSGVPNGAFLFWTGYGSPIKPGAEVSGFLIKSGYLPGLTTAYAIGGGAVIHPPTELPEEVEAQLIPIERPYVDWATTITLGPRFPPATATSRVLDAYLHDIRSLIDRRLVDRTSPALQTIKTVISHALESDTTPDFSQIKDPKSPLEGEIIRAIQVATEPR